MRNHTECARMKKNVSEPKNTVQLLLLHRLLAKEKCLVFMKDRSQANASRETISEFCNINLSFMHHHSLDIT
jgi:hypothetical protein